MKHFTKAAFILAFIVSGLPVVAAAPIDRVRAISSFDADWRFQKSDTPGAEKPEFNDSTWRKLDVPHDWSIEGPYAQTNTTGRGGGYLPAGIGWYRKQFIHSEADAKRCVFIEFDGVMASSEVWINGHHLGKRPFGYVSFRYELTRHLNFGPGRTNVIAVRADNTLQPASRWYAGAGIFRHVRLVVTEPIHIQGWDAFVTTPSVSVEQASVQIQTPVTNQSNARKEITVRTTLVDPKGGEIAMIQSGEPVQPGESIEVKQIATFKNPQLWSLDSPRLYVALIRLLDGEKEIDRLAIRFGIRQSEFKPDTGFWLNGRNLKLKGVCLHHDGGAVGAAVPLRVWERRLERLKEIGVNSVRVGHAPMAPEFYDLCDRLGLLVMNETFDTWTARKSNADHGYQLYFREWWEADTRDIVVRDRNHPSIILWSVGNEIRDNLDSPEGFKRFTDQRDLIQKLDGTRPVTMALFRPNQQRVYDNGFAELMDVVGQNYRENELVAAHRAKPERKVLGTENGHERGTWLILRDNSFMSGQFLWTGVDYLGESDWPNVVNGSGLLDRTGGMKPRAHERQSWWSDRPMVLVVRREGNAGAGELVSDWTPRDPDTYDDARVQVFSNCEEVELLLKDRSLGSKPRPADGSARGWSLPYDAGTLKAIGRNAGKVVATHELRTAGEPAKVILSADRVRIAHEWDDLSFVTATVVDKDGVPCPAAERRISFKLDGPGAIIAVDNADRASHEPYHATERKAWQGQCVAIVRATSTSGKIILSASAEGLAAGSIQLEAAAPSSIR